MLQYFVLGLKQPGLEFRTLCLEGRQAGTSHHPRKLSYSQVLPVGLHVLKPKSLIPLFDKLSVFTQNCFDVGPTSCHSLLSKYIAKMVNECRSQVIMFSNSVLDYSFNFNFESLPFIFIHVCSLRMCRFHTTRWGSSISPWRHQRGHVQWHTGSVVYDMREGSMDRQPGELLNW